MKPSNINESKLGKFEQDTDEEKNLSGKKQFSSKVPNINEKNFADS